MTLNNETEEPVEVISCGEFNSNSGPDFFNAIIRVEGLILAGNVEIHMNSSDWVRHGHHIDKAYDSVILQLVINDDEKVTRTNGEIIPTALLTFDSTFKENYSDLLGHESWISCQHCIDIIDFVFKNQVLYEMGIKRLEAKANLIGERKYYNRNCWEETFYQLLARNFGFSINGHAFEMLARALPYKYLLRQADSLFQIEAMLFGQAGMLFQNVVDDYFQDLKKEYRFLKSKYNLKPMEKHLWKFLRLRPANFPTIRISQFSAVIFRQPGLFSSVIECNDFKSLSELFRVSASVYWDTHFLFNKPSIKRPKNLGPFAIRSIIINTVVPALYYYGKQKRISKYSDRAIEFLYELPPENNSVISRWKTFGFNIDNAFASQALLHLRNEFCSYRRCLDCRIGDRLINAF